MDKPKEFWIDPTLIDDEEDTSVFDALKNKPTQGPLQWQASLIHVIEYSAFEQLQSKFNEAVEVLREISPDCNFLRSLDKGE